MIERQNKVVNEVIKLLRYLKEYKLVSVLGPLFKLIEACFELAVPLVMANMIEKGIYAKNTDYIMKQGGILLLLGFSGLLFSVIAQFFSAKAAIGMAAKLRDDLFHHIVHMPFQVLDQNSPATLVSRLTIDVNQVQNCVNMCLRLFLRSPFIVFGAMIMAFRVDNENAVIFTIIIPVLFLIVLGIIYITIPFYKKVQKQLDQVMIMVRENITGIRVIRAFGRQEKEKNDFQEVGNQLSKQQLLAGKVSILMNPITYSIINIGLIVILYQGSAKIDAGNMSQGAMIALLNYMSQILVELIKMASLIIYISKALSSADRINSIFLQKSEELVETGKINLEPIHSLQFEQVNFKYEGEQKNTLNSISFTVSKGQMIGIAGSMGMGKTTLLNLIAGYYKPDHGSIYAKKEDGLQATCLNLKGRTGMVFQESILFSGTIMENISLGRADVSTEEMLHALKLSQSSEFVEKMPKGIHSHVSKLGKNLSGGQKQRLAIARALVRDPEILIFDDSYSALDYLTESKLRKEIRTIQKEKIIFIASQRISSFIEADKILVLENGKNVGFDSHQNLMANCMPYREICQSQGIACQDRNQV